MSVSPRYSSMVQRSQDGVALVSRESRDDVREGKGATQACFPFAVLLQESERLVGFILCIDVCVCV